jgi:NAD(P)-dependent dehydrogenase (short-subunit alcohol dehydrogenase family)
MTYQQFALTDKVVVVTGGAGVLATAISKGLVQHGARIVCLDIDTARTEKLVADIRALGGDALGIHTDVLDKTALETAARQVQETFGTVDILINGAGGNKTEATATPGQSTFFDLPREALEWVHNLNFLSSVLASQVFGKIMVEHGGGVILNISSMAAIRPLTRTIAYCAGKASISNFTQWLAVYIAQVHSPNIRVNALAPGFFLGEQNRYLLIDEATGDLTPRGRQIIDHTPMGRFGEPEDLIGTVVWLVSDASRFVTGAIIPIDGGFSAYSGV